MEDEIQNINFNSNNLDEVIELLKQMKKNSEFSGSELRLIIKLLMDNDFFKHRKNYLSTNNIADIAGLLRLKYYKKDEVVYKRGDHLNYFYFILKGSIESIKLPIDHNDSSKKSNQFSENRETLSIGEGLGDYWILKNIPSEETILSKEDGTILGTLEFQTYVKILEPFEKKRINDILKYLKTLKFFKECSNQVLERLAFMTRENSIEKGTIIFKENDNIDGVYIVKEGNFMFFTKNGDEIVDLYEVNKQECFGDLEIIKNHAIRKYNVKCVSDYSSTLFYKKKELVYLLNDSISRVFKENSIKTEENIKKKMSFISEIKFMKEIGSKRRNSRLNTEKLNFCPIEVKGHLRLSKSPRSNIFNKK